MNITEARREFDAWVEREFDYVTGRPELCDWTPWMEAWQISEKLTLKRCKSICAEIANESEPDDFALDVLNAAEDAIRALGDE